MVEPQTGPKLSIIGSGITILFGIAVFNQQDISLVIAGLELISFKLGFALIIGLTGLVGGIMTLRGILFGNIILTTNLLIMTVAIIIPIGEIILYQIPDTYHTRPLMLYSPFFFIEIALISQGIGLSLSCWNTERIESYRVREEPQKIEDQHFLEIAILKYLEENKKKAFTSKVLYKKCFHSTDFNLSHYDIEHMLSSLHEKGKIGLSIKDNFKFYYFQG